MWNTSNPRRETRRQAETACHSCRRRKVKCDRAYPQCSVCEQRDQVCHYPPGPLRPGPKIGSFHRRGARTRERRDRQESQNADSAPAPSRESLDIIEVQASHSTTHPPSCRCSYDRQPSPVARVQARLPAITNNTQAEWSPGRDRHLKIHDLSFILHPSHEGPSPENDPPTVSSNGISDQEPELIATACAALGVDQSTVREGVKVYFDNMVAISLFHEPSFREKINGITSTSQMQAFLAAVLAFAARFYSTEAGGDANSILGETAEVHLQSAYLLRLAFCNIDKALKECDDEAPPLCVLQALIVATHCQLTQGVRGKAWRSLGTCIRLAYELNLHLIDADNSTMDAQNVDVHQWCENEEKRRAWWAIWEMDVFASTIRRTPPAVDWSQMETLLPVEDQDWFQSKPRPSCFMERDPISRWKAVQECGNQSSKAWFLVINSLMKEAQVISSPRSIPHRESSDNNQDKRSAFNHRPKQVRNSCDEASKKLELLANSVHCSTLALPANLQYRNQYLAFEARAPGQPISQRYLHCGIYNIFVMSQLARLMIYRHEVFRDHNSTTRRTHDLAATSTATLNSGLRSSHSSNSHEMESLALRQYFEAADKILTIVNRSSEDHIRHINPFLPSTIWLASAVQLLRMQFSRDDINRTLIKSKFEVLYFTYKRCVSFWDIQTALQQNLEALEAQLEGPEISICESQEQRSSTNFRHRSRYTGVESRSRDGTTSLQVDNDRRDTDDNNIIPGVNGEYNNSDNLLLTSPNTPPFQTPPSSVSSGLIYQTQARIPQQHRHQHQHRHHQNDQNNQHQQYQQYQQPRVSAMTGSASQRASHASITGPPSEAQSMATLGYTNVPPHVDRQQQLPGNHNENDQNSLYHNPRSPGGGLFDPLSLMGGNMPQHTQGLLAANDDIEAGNGLGYDWQNISLLSDIHNVLSGFSAY